jgi:hypothetical protein
MYKVMRLVRVQLWAVLSDMLSIGKNRSKKPKMLFAGILFFTLVMSSVAFIYCAMIGTGLKMYNSLDLLPALIMAVTSFVILITTIFKVKGTIFGFRDYDMVMSLPVSTGLIAISRLVILYALNFLFVIIMMIPMMAVYGILARPSFLFYIIGFITMLIVPLGPIVIASLIGTLIAYISSKFKRSNLLNLIISIAFFAAIVGSSFTFNEDGQKLLNITKMLTNRINQIYPLALLYRKALVDYDILALLLFVGISVLAFALYTILFHKVFKRMNTLMMTGAARTNYKLGELKTSSPLKSLYIKELKRYFSSTLYVLNTGFGIVMLTLGAIALIFVDLDKLLKASGSSEAMANYIPVYVIFCTLFTCTTMVSISLEGKNVWIMKSLPVLPKTVFLSKIAVNLTILSPAILDAILIGIILKMDPLQVFSMLLVVMACGIFISLYGLVINLLLPNFNWTAEVTVIKQSAATMITVFSGMGYAAVLFVFIAAIQSAVLAYLGFFLLTVVLDVILYRIIVTYGYKRFYSF